MKNFILTLVLFTLLPAIGYTNPYDVNYFMKNPDDIAEQLDICQIQIWKAKSSGNLADVKAAKNNPACVAAKQARQKIKDEKANNAQKEYEARKQARAALNAQAEKLAQGSTMNALKARQEKCDDTLHPVLGRGGTDCAKLSKAISIRKKLDVEVAITSFRNGGRMSEKERFTLLARTGKCQKEFDRVTCQHIQRAQQLDKQAYQETYQKDRNAAKAMLKQCKPPFFKALAAAKAIKNAGDRSRAVGDVVNLYKPPFNKPLACKSAANSLGEYFGMMKPE